MCIHPVNTFALTPAAQDNLSVNLRRSSDLISTSDGYMRVFHKTNSVGIEYYNNSLQITGRRKLPWSCLSGAVFMQVSDGYYLIEGQKNDMQKTTLQK